MKKSFFPPLENPNAGRRDKAITVVKTPYNSSLWKVRAFLTGFIFIAIFLLSSLSVSARDSKTLFETKCSRCHLLERALNKTKSLNGWKKTTRRMVKNSGGMISSEEAEMIAEYLAGRNLKKETRDTDMPGVFDFKKLKVSQFIEPAVCEECHSEIFEQWNGSMHSRAFTDPVWRSATKLFVKDAVTPGELLEMKACVKCHTPLGFRSHSISSPTNDYDKLADLPAQGIFCNWCHNIKEVQHLGLVRQVGDGEYEVEPGGGEDDPSTMLGPFKDSKSDFHPTKYSELHTKSEFCGLCHNVSHAANRLPIEQTYNEWKNSPYNTGNPKTTVNCQDCHMRQRPGIPSTGKTERPDNPGTACDDGPEREHIWTHYFIGGNSVVPKLFGNDMHAKMAVERLQNAADLEIIRTGSYIKTKLSHIKVKVINSGAGHYLPTGLTEVRQMWLDIRITDAKGKIILRSGALDDKSSIDKNAVIYKTVLGNEKGEPVLNVAKADRILSDNRIPPKGFVIENYAFYLPADAVSPLKVEATLKYRSASQSLAKTLLGNDAPEIPVIDMVSVAEKIKF